MTSVHKHKDALTSGHFFFFLLNDDVHVLDSRSKRPFKTEQAAKFGPDWKDSANLLLVGQLFIYAETVAVS